MKLYQATCVITWVLILVRGAPTKSGRAKKSTIWQFFRHLSTLSAKTSRIYRRNGNLKVRYKTTTLRYWAKKFGELWSTNKKVIDVNVSTTQQDC